MAAPNFYDDNRKAGELLREHRQLDTLLKSWTEYGSRTSRCANKQELAESGDAEMAALPRCARRCRNASKVWKPPCSAPFAA